MFGDLVAPILQVGDLDPSSTEDSGWRVLSAGLAGGLVVSFGESAKREKRLFFRMDFLEEAIFADATLQFSSVL